MIAIDFDDTLATHPQPYDPSVTGEPLKGAIAFIRALHNAGFEIAILSARAYDPRGKEAIVKWIKEHELDDIIQLVTHLKLPVFDLIIDDRAIHFDGSNYRDILKEIIRRLRGE